MANIASFCFSALSQDFERPNPDSVKAFVASINDFIAEFLENNANWNFLKLKCLHRLNIKQQEFFEFSEHSIVSNLYWGIESIEAAIHAKCPEEKSIHFRNSEQMLQVPAMLDENGVTAGIQNQYLVCCSYFYLSVVSKLQNDDWKVAQHFLQAIIVFPALVRTEIAPQLCKILFPASTTSLKDAIHAKINSSDESARYFNKDNIEEAISQISRRYKYWLMYYQVMLYEPTPRWHQKGRETSRRVDESQYFLHVSMSSSESSNSTEERCSLQTCNNYEKVHPLDHQAYINNHAAEKLKVSCEIKDLEGCGNALNHLDQVSKSKIQEGDLHKYTSITSIQEVLMESESDTPTSVSPSDNYFLEEDDLEENMDDAMISMRTARKSQDDLQPAEHDQKLETLSSSLNQISEIMSLPHAPPSSMREEADEVTIPSFISGRLLRSMSKLDLSVLEHRNKKLNALRNCYVEDDSSKRQSLPHNTPTTDCIEVKKSFNELCMQYRKFAKIELMGILQKAISKLRRTDGLARFEEDYTLEVTTIYEMLNNKKGVKYTILRDVILEQLLTVISSSKEERVIRASVSILATIVSVNKSAIEEIKKKGLQLCDLATALKQNVHEAATLIYLINPSPTEIKTLELLPALVEVVCASNTYLGRPELPLLTPPAASLMIIEVLVTAFDCDTNNMHLAAINSPRVLCSLLDIAKNNNLEEHTSLANIIVKCMRFDENCRKYVSECIPVAPFISLLQSNHKEAKYSALEFFNEILQIPRSSAISLLQRIKKEGGADIKQTLMSCVQDLEPDYQLLAANLLLQLDIMENSSGKSVFKEEAMEIILKSVASEEESTKQQLSAFILANIGGTYSWTGEPYTVAWLVKKAGLTSFYHRKMIKNYDWLDQVLQDAGTDAWTSKIARAVITTRKPVFEALEKGLKSKIKTVSRDCLTAIAWIGCEISKSPYSVRHSACETLLSGIEQFLHPGFDLEERLLACLCIYNYASGRGMQKLIHFSEGVRESLRRFSSVTWMAEELHRVADYYLPNKSVSHNSSGAVAALIYYRGLLCCGFSDGSIKVWDVKLKSSTLLWDTKEHKKAVTCFALCEAGESLLSGSADKTIRVWQMVQKKLECTEVIGIKEPIRKLESYGQMIFVITQGYRMKVLDSSRTVKDICKTKKVKCMTVVNGKAYVGCMDSSIQELTIGNNKEREIKPPANSWRMQNKPTNAVTVYKDWLYSASSIVEGLKVKEWRTNYKPQMTILTEKARNLLAMEVVEDFIYLNCSSSTSTIQIWLRGTQQKVGRISAGSRITSLLTANDIVLCGTEKGLIKGWIPL